MIRYHTGTVELMRRLDSIHPHQMNPLSEDVEEIDRTIDRVGVFLPIVVSSRTGDILAGEGLYNALLARGETEGPILLADDESEEEALVMLLASYAHIQAAWVDPGLEVPVLKTLMETEWGLVGTGYDEGIFDRRMAELQELSEGIMGEGPPTIQCPNCHTTIEIDRMK